MSTSVSRPSPLWMGAAAMVGLVTWLICSASAPRYSFGAEQEMVNPAYWWVLVAAAFVIGLVATEPCRPAAVLPLPALVLAPWTAPRGDNDGLWLLILPMLAMFALLLVAVASIGAWTRRSRERS